MQQAFQTMLALQDRMNSKVHPQWMQQGYEWYRAIWIECAELMDHQGYKWWKRQQADLPQVQLEVIDIWHFGISDLLVRHGDATTAAQAMSAALDGWQAAAQGVHQATESLAAHALTERAFCVRRFWTLMQAAGLDFDALYRQYVGKNILNLFRQDHGYKEGTYVKRWQGREDNEHLVELLDGLDSQAADFSDALYAALARRYDSAVTAVGAG